MQKNNPAEQTALETNPELKNEAEKLEKPEKNKPKSKKTLWLVISICCLLIIIIGFLLIQKSKKGSNNQPINPQESQSQSNLPPTDTQKLTKEELLFRAFRYPNGNEQPAGDNIYCVQLIMNTNDTAETVYQYYSDLIELNNWETGPVGIQTYDKIGFLHIYQDDFRASINFHEEAHGDKLTIIEVDITCLNDQTVTSTFNLPVKPEETTKVIDPTPEAVTQIENEYVLPFSNTEAVVKTDLENLTPWELKVARNEIYARHGRPFVHQDLTCYFAKQSWYKIDQDYQEGSLSELEITNAVFVLNFEKEINSPLINRDTGCN